MSDKPDISRESVEEAIENLMCRVENMGGGQPIRGVPSSEISQSLSFKEINRYYEIFKELQVEKKKLKAVMEAGKRVVGAPSPESIKLLAIAIEKLEG